MLNFLKDLDNDLRKALSHQLRNLWTHTSTSIKGNTLTLGETAFVLKSGLPPIIIPREQRKEYIDSLSAYHFSAGQIKAGEALLPNQDTLKSFSTFCEQAWEESLAIVGDMQQRQQSRKE
ncbi:MAG: hypothetical protein GY699_12260 [Desulfobacteraceae bacterium]|nr:hypothetical protein [Desulfobacteraceae bacterium]